MQIALVSTDDDKMVLGIRAISSVLKEAGYQTKILLMKTEENYLSDKALDEAKTFLEEMDVIGVSCYAKGSEKAKQLISYLRFLQKPIIWGGLHATLNPEECARSADIVCMGEGEETILELVDALAKDTDWRNIANLAYKKNGSVYKNPLRPLITDLDRLPVADFTFENEYHLNSKRNIKVYSPNDPNDNYEIWMIGSRGCYFECTYCCNSKLKEIYSNLGRYVRKMSSAKYVGHLVEVKKYFPHARCFVLGDEDFFSRSIEDIETFTNEYSKKIDLPFEVCGSAITISDEKIDLLTKAGLWRVRIGIESGSERTKQEVYNRRVPNSAVKKVLEIINAYPQVVAYCFMIITNPYEESKDLIETAKLMLELSWPYYLLSYNLIFFPGSLLYERAVQDGFICGKEDSGFELNFRAGLKYQSHPWKLKNLYLNGVLFLMEGKSTGFRIGFLPRALIPVLLRPNVVKYNEEHLKIIRFLIQVKIYGLSLRSKGAKLLKRLLGDPTAVYDLKGFVRRKIGREKVKGTRIKKSEIRVSREP